MSTADYDIHLDRGRFDSLFLGEDETGHPFSEDLDDLEKVLAEELGEPKPRRKRKVRRT